MIRVHYNYTLSGYVDIEEDDFEDAEGTFDEMLNAGEIDFSADETVEEPYIIGLENLDTGEQEWY